MIAYKVITRAAPCKMHIRITVRMIGWEKYPSLRRNVVGGPQKDRSMSQNL